MQLFKVSANTAVFRDDRLLVLQRADTEDFLAGYWETAGGGIEEGETIEDAARRESREESGIEIENIEPYFCFMYRDGAGQPSINVLVRADWKSGEPTPQDGMAHAKWVTIHELDTLKMTDEMRDALKRAFAFHL
ncbi:MAG: NUDIX hydrolase [bacterium]|nr:NUDIX hydrolase [bacterium]